MRKHLVMMAGAAALLLLAAGCQSLQGPANTSTGLNGFILKQADKNSGYIYGVWQDTYERQYEYSEGSFLLTQLGTSSSWYAGFFFSRTATYKQIEVSVTLEPLAQTQTLVRLVSRFDNEGVPTAHGVFASRFFGLLRKEIFLRKNSGSIYQKFGAN